MFKTIGILGLGLIGGSLAKALKKYNYGATIYGYNRNQTSALAALESGTIDTNVTDFADFADCDLIVLCCPVNINIRLFKDLKPYLKETCIITDVGSTKNDIFEAMMSMDYKGYFIGGHPMAGSEKSGFTATKAELFENAFYILTPEDGCPKVYVDDMKVLIKNMHGLPVVLDSKKHDYIVAAISHVPHILASTLVNMVEDIDSENKEMYTLAAGGFKDFTRIASSSPDMWQQICIANKDSVVSILDVYQDMIEQAKKSISSESVEDVYGLFDQSKRYRNTFENKIRGSIEKTYGMTVDINDEPGVIATIATHLGNKEINIKNIGINNNREDYDGVLEIIFYDGPSLENGRELIKSLGYDVIES